MSESKPTIQKIYPLSPMQEGMLFHSALDNKDNAYFEQMCYTIHGELNFEVFEKSYNLLIARYDIFRSNFIYDKVKKPVQVVFDKKKASIYYEDISQMDEQQIEYYIKNFKLKDIEAGFDLVKDIPMRMSLFKMKAGQYKIIWSHHHILMDGWCLGIITKEFFQFYNCIMNDEEIPYSSVVQYDKYIEWLGKQDKKEAEDYWVNYLAGIDQIAVLPKNLSETDKAAIQEECIINLNSELTNRIQRLGQTYKSTINIVMQGVWGILMQRYTGAGDIVFGAVVSGRTAEVENIENMVGLFINTIPVRIRYTKELSFLDIIEQLRSNFLESEKFSYLSLAMLQSLTALKQNLIDHLLVFENYPLDRILDLTGGKTNEKLKLSEFEGFEQTNYDLTVIFIPGDELSIKIKYNPSVYNRETIEFLSKHFKKILESVTITPTVPIQKLEMLTTKEVNTLLYDFNATKKSYEKDISFCDIFEQQVLKTPNDVALIYKDKTITYKELNKKANMVAWYLREKGVKKDSVIGVLAERSSETVIGIIGILKAGGAYVPIDPCHPSERIQYMLDNSKTAYLLTRDEITIDADNTEIINLNEILNKNDIPAGNLQLKREPNSLMYVLYTSGSTGQPKGIMAKSHSFMNLLYWYIRDLYIDEKERVLLIASMSFDAAQKNIFCALMKGGKLFLYPSGTYEYEDISDLIQKEKITMVNCTPSAFYPIIDYNERNNFERLKSLHKVIFGGETIFKNRLLPWVSSGKYNAHLINSYGPTECTDVVSSYWIDKSDIIQSKIIPIGKPIDNTVLFILDLQFQLVPIGVTGEICIGGAGVSRGYYRNPKLTEERFITWEHFPESKIYRTGDMGRWLADGNIEFLGRMDNQIKIRGFRIELGEIEACLSKYDGIDEHAVTVRDGVNGDKYLCVYYTSGIPQSSSDIKQYLSDFLPDYMIPVHYIRVDFMPLTPNGKIDRKALSEIQINYSDKNSEPPRNETEKELVMIWESILELSGIGIDDNFFDIGGHSLNATIMVSRIHKALNILIPLKSVMSFPTVRQLSEYIDRQDTVTYSAIKSIESRTYYPASSAQKRMYILWEMDKQSTTYNMPGAVIIEGNFRRASLEKIFNALVLRHEGLRTTFDIINQEIVQKVHTDVDFKMEYEEAQEQEKEVLVQGFLQAFDLISGPLLRVKLIKLSHAKHVLLTDMHHIISDGISAVILIKEFISMYNGQKLPNIKIQYRDYSAWHHGLMQSGVLKRQEEYWLKLFDGEIPLLNLQTDYQRKIVQDFEGDNYEFEIDGKLMYQLKRLALDKQSTLYMVLLSAFNILLYKYTGQEDIIIGSAVAGRRHADLENVIGMFVNMLPMRNWPTKDMSFEQFLSEVRKNVLDAFENQDYPFEKLIEELDIERNIGRNPLFDVVFAMQDKDVMPQFDKEVTFTQYNIDNKISKFDITVTGIEGSNSIIFNLEYCKTLFHVSTIQRFAEHFKQILIAITENKSILLKDIDILKDEEKQKILIDFNQTEVKYRKDRKIQELFEEQANKTPNGRAVVCRDETITYKQLNERANRLANILLKRGLRANEVVGVMLHRSTEAIVAILAILKARGIYLPIDSNFPENRVTDLLNDSDTAFLITEESSLNNFSYIALKRNAGDDVTPVLTPVREPIKDLDSLPMVDRSLIDYNKYSVYIGNAMVKNAMSISDSRGCPYNCAYCFKIWPKTYASRSAENLFEEIMFYYKAGIRRFNFINDAFNLDMKNSGKFFEMIITNKLDVQLYFPSGLRGDRLSKEYIDLLAEAGTVNLALALETAVPRLQKLINKNLDLDKFRMSAEYISHKYPHIITEMFTMHGLPSETEKEALETLDFIKSIKWIDFPYILILKVYPNTDMYRIALEHGVSKESIERSVQYGFSELPETLPFAKEFTREYQTKFLNEYMLSKERLRSVLPHQAKIMTSDELIQKYNSYLPIDIKNMSQILQLCDMTEADFYQSHSVFVKEEEIALPKNFSNIMSSKFRKYESDSNSFRILFLDLNLFFSDDNKKILYDVVEPPLGQMYIMTYLNQKFKNKIKGKIAKSRIDFNSYKKLRELISDFKPDLIGIGCLTFYRDFFHRTVAEIRDWGVGIPIVAGGPYATSSYSTLLKDKNVDLAVLGEGEITFGSLIQAFINNDKKLPNEETLSKINGISYLSGDDIKKKKGVYREILIIDKQDTEYEEEALMNVEDTNHNTDMAYVIYTSGSTGSPKGVMIKHQGVINLANWFGHTYQLDKNRHILQSANLSFDVSIEEIFSALLSGSTLFIPDNDIIYDKHRFAEYINKNSINVAQFVPAMLKELIADNVKLESLNVIICGGEAIDKSLKDLVIGKGYHLFNHYGPTEITVDAIAAECREGEVILGKPIFNTNVYIVNQDGQLQGIGIPGELCISGDGLALGYFNNIPLTLEKFINSSTISGRRMYKTGDMARWLPNGEIDFLGRVDNQVKIRGIRIEMEEIEKRLLLHKDIKEAVVLVMDSDENKHLGAFFIEIRTIRIAELKEYLALYLPSYMIPSQFIKLDQLPYTVSGKIDRAALAKYEKELSSTIYIEAEGKTEEILVQMWKDILNLELASVEESFFDLGGYSLKAMTLVSRINKEFHVEISLKDIFHHLTIRKLAKLIDGKERNKHLMMEPAEQRAYYTLSSAQKRIFIEEQFGNVGSGYNIPIVLIAKGTLNCTQLNKACNIMLKRHESLRTSFHLLNGEPIQKIQEKLEIQLKVLRIKEEEINSQIRKLVKPFDLRVAPLMRVYILEISESYHMIIFDFHHIIADGESMNIFLNELIEIYQGNTLGKLHIQYKDYVEWQSKFIMSDRIGDQEKYWLDQFSGRLPNLNLPLDYARAQGMKSYEGDRIEFELPKKLTEELQKRIQALDTTLYIYLLSAYSVILSKYCNEEDIIVGTPVSGRTRIGEEPLIGIFINIIAMRNYPKADKTFLDFLTEVKINTLNAFENQDYQFEMLLDKLKLKRDFSRSPLFDTTFVVQRDEISHYESEQLDFTPYPFEKNTTPYDIVLEAIEKKDNIVFSMQYATKLFKKESVKKLGRSLIELIRMVVNHEQEKIIDFDVTGLHEDKENESRKELLRDKMDFDF